jgi:hypothetical protein
MLESAAKFGLDPHSRIEIQARSRVTQTTASPGFYKEILTILSISTFLSFPMALDYLK